MPRRSRALILALAMAALIASPIGSAKAHPYSPGVSHGVWYPSGCQTSNPAVWGQLIGNNAYEYAKVYPSGTNYHVVTSLMAKGYWGQGWECGDLGWPIENGRWVTGNPVIVALLPYHNWICGQYYAAGDGDFFAMTGSWYEQRFRNASGLEQIMLRVSASNFSGCSGTTGSEVHIYTGWGGRQRSWQKTSMANAQPGKQRVYSPRFAAGTAFALIRNARVL